MITHSAVTQGGDAPVTATPGLTKCHQQLDFRALIPAGSHLPGTANWEFLLVPAAVPSLCLRTGIVSVFLQLCHPQIPARSTKIHVQLSLGAQDVTRRELAALTQPGTRGANTCSGSEWGCTNRQAPH